MNLTTAQKEKLSPMMRQYLNIKEETGDAILFFRLGDFYEMFFDDAERASKELEITLTGKECGLEERAPMCGVPYHSAEAYLARLVAKGYKVAICEQTEDASKAKGLVSRDVVRVVTPGTIIEDSMLDQSSHNYLSVVALFGEECGVCFVDVSTGQLLLTELSGEQLPLRISNELGRFFPREVLLSREASESRIITDFINMRLNVRSEMLQADDFSAKRAEDIIPRHFGKKPESLGVSTPALASALGAALTYLYQTQRQGLDSISDVEIYDEDQYLKLDIAARRNLELVETLRGDKHKGTLLSVLDRTKTSMGKRLLRSWIEQPLISRTSIMKRQSAVAELRYNTVMCDRLGARLDGIYDLERLMTRVVYGTANARELRALSDTLRRLPALKNAITGCTSAMLIEMAERVDPLDDLYDKIVDTLREDPPVSVKEGGIIRDGFSEDVDTLRGDMNGGTDIIADIQASERKATGIKTLKIGFNKVFGYYIEVTNSLKHLVPDRYIRKQTLAGCERYITDEIKNLEGRILGAKDRVTALEYEIFENLRRQIGNDLHRIQRTASAVAQIDALHSLGDIASNNGYCQPDIASDGVITIESGRHAVIENLLPLPFVPNDTLLDNNENRTAIITGPNMAGKSTYMRQVALIVLMAQMGGFVPAKKAHIGVVDAIFTRVGASDDIAGGQSTFIVEMNEVATILKNATVKSLIILDEIGRGTSTFDGMSIARAVLEHVTDSKKLGARTLFATHYHELTELEKLLEGVKNYNIAVKKRGDDITFLRRIVRGGADDSYGIEVAKLAGVPDTVISRAKNILSALEQNTVPSAPRTGARPSEPEEMQQSLSAGQSAELIAGLKSLDVDTLTPIEALNELHRLISEAKKI